MRLRKPSLALAMIIAALTAASAFHSASAAGGTEDSPGYEDSWSLTSRAPQNQGLRASKPDMRVMVACRGVVTPCDDPFFVGLE
jgi:hypothetical protein